jgi:hypothetical protein
MRDPGTAIVGNNRGDRQVLTPMPLPFTVWGATMARFGDLSTMG